MNSRPSSIIKCTPASITMYSCAFTPSGLLKMIRKFNLCNRNGWKVMLKDLEHCYSFLAQSCYEIVLHSFKKIKNWNINLVTTLKSDTTQLHWKNMKFLASCIDFSSSVSRTDEPVRVSNVLNQMWKFHNGKPLGLCLEVGVSIEHGNILFLHETISKWKAPASKDF